MNNAENKHLSFEQLADYVDGRLATAESAGVERHLAAGCLACREELAWLQETTAVMAERWEVPDGAVRANVQRAFRHYVPANGPVAAQKETAGRWWLGLFRPKMGWVAAVVGMFLVIWVGMGQYQDWNEGVVQQTASLIEMKGDVEVQPSGSQSWLPLTGKTILRAGDRIRTNEDSSLSLQLFKNNTIYLEANTQIEIVALTVRRDGREKIITLKQLTGQVYSTGWPPEGDITRLSIVTPEAVVAVQAQGYEVMTDTAQKTEISLIKGCAEIVNYDPVFQTSSRRQIGSTCGRTPPVQNDPIAPVREL